MDAGHEARLLADAATLTGAQALGVATTALAGDIRGVFSPKHAVAGVVAKGGGFNATARALAKIANENAESWLRAIIEAGGRLRCDPGGGAGRVCRPFRGRIPRRQGHRLRHDPDHADRGTGCSLALEWSFITVSPARRTLRHARACLPS
jgi:hypothetical protein